MWKIVLNFKKSWLDSTNINKNNICCLDFYIEEVKLSQKLTFNWNDINIVNTSMFWLSQIAEMNSYKNHLEDASAGMGCSGFGIICL